MKFYLTILILLTKIYSFGQNIDDSKIIIILNDTTNLFQKVKYSFVNNDFMVKENGNADTITTYAREFNGIYCIARAFIKDNIVTLTGIYGLKRIDDWGYTQAPKNYTRVTFYKGSKTWKLLMQVATRLQGEIKFDK